MAGLLSSGTQRAAPRSRGLLSSGLLSSGGATGTWGRGATGSWSPWDEPGAGTPRWIADQLRQARDAPAQAGGYRGSVLPLSQDAAGNLSLAVPGALYGLGIGLFDGMDAMSADSPVQYTRQLSPEALGAFGLLANTGALLPAEAGGGTVLRSGLGPRGARQASDAEQMGFGPHTWYHGTASDLRAVDPAMYGAVTNNPFSRSGFMVTRDPAVAGDFAELAARAPSATVGPNIVPLRIGMRNARVLDLEGRAMSNMELRQNLEEAIADAEARHGSGPDTVIFRNMPTKAGSGPRRVSDVAVVLDPTRARSVFAAFDPAKAHSTDLLAGLAAAGLIVPMAGAAGTDDTRTASATAR